MYGNNIGYRWWKTSSLIVFDYARQCGYETMLLKGFKDRPYAVYATISEYVNIQVNSGYLG